MMPQSQEFAPQPKSTILCVDDHADYRTLLAYLLGQEGYGVLVAENLAQARVLAERVPFHLFILDVRLPDGSGIDLCKQLLQISPGTPVVFCSGVCEDGDMQMAREAGGTVYLRKPVSPLELRETVVGLLGKQ